MAPPEKRALPNDKKKKSPHSRRLFSKKSRQRPTLPHGFPCSTIGSEELNFRVRDGIGCGLFDVATGNLGSSPYARFPPEGSAWKFRLFAVRERLATRILGASSSPSGAERRRT